MGTSRLGARFFFREDGRCWNGVHGPTLSDADALCLRFAETLGIHIPTAFALRLVALNDRDYKFGATVDNAIEQNAFSSSTLADQPYWTGTPSNNAGQRWGVSFKDGTMVSLNQSDATGFYVRCVK